MTGKARRVRVEGRKRVGVEVGRSVTVGRGGGTLAWFRG
jgi:hypothetical protein